MKRLRTAAILLALCAALLLIGCDNVEPEVRGTPTPSASPTPLPDVFTAEITASPVERDLLGVEIQSDAHFERYLSFGDIRVYEYDNGTFLDGMCVNAYPLALDGQMDIVFYDASGKVCGEGTLLNVNNGTILETGANRIHAEIQTDIDVRMMDFVREVRVHFQPVAEPSPTP